MVKFFKLSLENDEKVNLPKGSLTTERKRM